MSTRFYVYAFYESGKKKPFYIGKGEGNRINAHFEAAKLKAKSPKNSKIKSIWAADGEVLIKKLRENLSEIEAAALETKYIQRYGRKDLGTGCLTNMTDGGDGMSGYQFSLAHCIMRRTLSKGRVFSDEHRQKISQSRKGMKFSDEHKAELSRVRKGVTRGPHTEETKQKMSAAKKGKVFSEAHKAALKAAQQRRHEDVRAAK